MYLKKISSFLVSLSALCLLSANLALAQGKTYKVGMIHWIAYSPNNVADVKGFWKEQGIDVKVVNFGNNQDLNSALENGAIDVAHDMIGSWVGMYQDGVPLTVVGETDWSNGGDKIIVKKDVDLNSLKGQRIGVYLNKPSVTFFLSKFLASKGLKLSDIEAVEVEPEAMANAFIAGKYKVIVNYDPQALRAEREGAGVLAATSASYEGVIPEGFVMRTDKFKAMPKEDLVKFFKGWAKAVKWSSDAANWAEYKTILNSKTFEGEPPYSEKDLKDMIASVKIHDAATQLARNQDGGGLVKYLSDLKDFLKANALLKKDFQPAELFNNAAMKEALQ